jgi:Mg2+ and Co2+ transporter CorA
VGHVAGAGIGERHVERRLRIAFGESRAVSERSLRSRQHLIGAIQAIRDMTSNLQELYLTTVSNNMNQVINVLAVIATIFIPFSVEERLTFEQYLEAFHG